MGPPRKLLRWFQERRLQAAVFVQVQLYAQDRRVSSRLRNEIGVDATGARLDSIIAIEGAYRFRYRCPGDESPRQFRGNFRGHGDGRLSGRGVEEDRRLSTRSCRTSGHRAAGRSLIG